MTSYILYIDKEYLYSQYHLLANDFLTLNTVYRYVCKRPEYVNSKDKK